MVRKTVHGPCMLATKYCLTLFSHCGRPALSLRLPAWAFLVALLFLALLAAGNAVLFPYAQLSRQAGAALREQRLQRLEHSEGLVRAASQTRGMEQYLRRMADFNAKVRIMLGIDDAQGRDLAEPPRSARGLRMLPALHRRNMPRNLWSRLDDLDEIMAAEEIRQQDIALALGEQAETLAAIPAIMPTHGRLSSPFGWRLAPFTGQKRFHKGIDLAARTGTSVRATANGLVTRAARSSSYGNILVVTHSAKIKTLYAHLSKFAVQEGERVLRGQVIGYVGSTGRSNAPHLHYEVQVNGRPVNPLHYILQ